MGLHCEFTWILHFESLFYAYQPIRIFGDLMSTHPQELPSSPLLRPFYPALDGLRAVAFLMVFLVHYGSGTIYIPYLSRLFDWGWVGVD